MKKDGTWTREKVAGICSPSQPWLSACATDSLDDPLCLTPVFAFVAIGYQKMDATDEPISGEYSEGFKVVGFDCSEEYEPCDDVSGFLGYVLEGDSERIEDYKLQAKHRIKSDQERRAKAEAQQAK